MTFCPELFILEYFPSLEGCPAGTGCFPLEPLKQLQVSDFILTIYDIQFGMVFPLITFKLTLR
jgi:hypothetical protein